MSRIGKSLEHTVISTFHNRFTQTHQKGRRVTINLQPLVNVEPKKLIDENPFIKWRSCSDKNFISPIVTIQKTYKTFKLAVDSKILH